MGTVEYIHVSEVAGGPMRVLDEAFVTPGSGLVGDRYAHGAGFWTDQNVSRDLTFVESEVIEELARVHGIGLPPGATRRNVTTRGVRLNDLVGRFFWVGDGV